MDDVKFAWVLAAGFDRCYPDAEVAYMIHTLAERLASVLVSRGAVRKSDDDIYTYAFEIILSTAVNLTVCLIMSCIFGLLLEGIIFTVVFAILRKHIGGHHAKTHLGCIMAFSGLLLLSLLILSLFPQHIHKELSVILSILSVLIIFMLAPVAHENKPITDALQAKLKKRSRLIASLLGVICVWGIFWCNATPFTAVSLSMACVCGSMAYAVFINKRKEAIIHEGKEERR